MATLAAIRAGLATNLGTWSDVQVSAYALSNPTPPCEEIVPSSVTYDLALKRGADTYHLTVRVFVGLVSDIGAQKRLDLFLAGSGSGSMKTAVELDATLGGACADVRDESSTCTRAYGKGQNLGAEWELELLV